MNYKQVYAIKAKNESKIKNICPNITAKSGIYVFFRVDENEIKHCYVGQAKNLLQRTAQHLSEYDRIALSLKKRGFYGQENVHGWRLIFKECPVECLDDNEKLSIKTYANKGYQLYNSTSGGQGQGKNGLDKNRPSKGYYDGLEQGKKNTQRFIADLFAKHLDVVTKKNPPTKLQAKALQKFEDFLHGEQQN